jgi:hypothetical protein
MTTDRPLACTLTAGDYRARLAEIAALSRDALRAVERRDCVIDLRYAPEAAERVQALVDKERACCAFLEFDVHVSADEVQLIVTVPPAALDAVPELLHELTAGTMTDRPEAARGSFASDA